jgi:lipid-binding SYLF domain-containing protein
MARAAQAGPDGCAALVVLTYKAEVRSSMAILVFPTVVKAGFGIGAEYGQGALQIGGRSAAYYNIIPGSIGFQFGAQARSVMIVFMTEPALAQFQATDGWKVGIDGSITILAIGAGGAIDTNSITSPIVGFIFDQKGPHVQSHLGRLQDQPYRQVTVLM